MMKLAIISLLLILGSCVNSTVNIENSKFNSAGVFSNSEDLPPDNIQDYILQSARDQFSKLDRKELKRLGVSSVVVDRSFAGKNMGDPQGAQVYSFDKNHSHVITYAVSYLFKDLVLVTTLDKNDIEIIDNTIKEQTDILMSGSNSKHDKRLAKEFIKNNCYWLVESTVGKDENIYMDARGLSPFAGKDGINIGIDRDSGVEVKQFPVYVFIRDCQGQPPALPQKMLVNVVKATDNKSNYLFSKQLGIFWRDIKSQSGSLNSGKEFAVTVLIIKIFSEIFGIDFDEIVNEAKNKKNITEIQKLSDKIPIFPVIGSGKEYWNLDKSGNLDIPTQSYINKFVDIYAMDLHNKNYTQILFRMKKLIKDNSDKPTEKLIFSSGLQIHPRP